MIYRLLLSNGLVTRAKVGEKSLVVSLRYKALIFAVCCLYILYFIYILGPVTSCWSPYVLCELCPRFLARVRWTNIIGLWSRSTVMLVNILSRFPPYWRYGSPMARHCCKSLGDKQKFVLYFLGAANRVQIVDISVLIMTDLCKSWHWE